MKNRKLLDIEKIINTCQLPKDVFLGASLISVTGNSEAFIENFKNIIKYSQEEITIQCKRYQVGIVGEKLSIECYSKEELKITGNIMEIKFFAGNHL